MHAYPHHPTRVRCSQQSPQAWWLWALTWQITLAAALLWTWMVPHLTQAKTFRCGATDTQCIMASITEANTNGYKTNDIRLEAGTYTLSAINNSTDGPNGLPSVTSTLTITGDGADTTILDRASSVGFRLVHVAASGTLTLEGLTLRNGFTSGVGGGGIRNHGALTVTNCILENNIGEGGGGGIRNHGILTLTNSTMAHNNAIEEGGGGLKNFGTATITNSTLVCNLGNGLHNASGIMTVTNSTLAHNASISIVGEEDSFCNSFLVSNADDAPGGGIFNESGTMTVINSTVTNNRSRNGGGIWNPGGTVTVQNTILARNTLLGSGQNSDCAGPITSLGNNLIGDPTGCAITLQPTDLAGDSAHGSLDPRLGPFTDTGEPGEGYFPLLLTSPAINTGNDAACPKTDQLGEKRVGPCDMGAIEFPEKIISSR